MSTPTPPPPADLVPLNVTRFILSKVGDQDFKILTQKITFGDSEETETESILQSCWILRADKDAIAPDLRMHYVLQDCIDVLLGQVWGQVDKSLGDEKTSLGQKAAHLQAIRSNADSDIDKIKREAAGSRPAAVGQMNAGLPHYNPNFGNGFGRYGTYDPFGRPRY